MGPRRLISVVAGCFNEEGNVAGLYEGVRRAFAGLPGYDFELIFIDNRSTDRTAERVAAMCAADPRVKLIANARNFGHVRSPYHALLQASGDAAICMASDLQDPPELIPSFVQAWEQGASVAAGVYDRPPEGGLLGMCRNVYYKVINAVSETPPIPAFTGFGLYDRRVIELLRGVGGPYPFVRGLVAELGLPIRLIPFKKKPRAAGVTKNNFLTLLDLSILGLTSMSRAPVRFATMLGAAMSGMGFLLAFAYLVAKLVFWDQFVLGQAPLLIGIFLFGSVQILIAGLIGEYVASLHQRAQNHPHVVELYRVNFPPAQAAHPALGPVRSAELPEEPGVPSTGTAPRQAERDALAS